ncbi:MAG: nicotinamide riboside transporter PnuC [Bacteroidota bacterium]|nr:nicotinamide riboside transporter PnuC [Bacteroidota bacterium]
MSLPEISKQFISGLQQTGAVEFIAVISGIVSVYFSQKANIWVYPTGILNTVIYIYISLAGNLLGEASVNIFYTIMSIYGWVLWLKKDETNKTVLAIRYSTMKEWLMNLLFFGVIYLAIFLSLSYLKKDFAPGAIPVADAFASASAYTGMLLMARKKVESWIWWIITNTASIPLYFIKGYVFTSFQFVVLLVMAVVGLVSWHKKAKYARD